MGGQSLFCGSDAETEPASLRLFILVIDGEALISKCEEKDARRHPKIYESTQAECLPQWLSRRSPSRRRLTGVWEVSIEHWGFPSTDSCQEEKKGEKRGVFSVGTRYSTLDPNVNGSLQIPRRGGKSHHFSNEEKKKERLIYYKLLGTKIIWTSHLDSKLAPVVNLPLGCFPVDGIRASDRMVNKHGWPSHSGG